MVREGIFFCTGINTVSTAGYNFLRSLGQILPKVIDHFQSTGTDHRNLHFFHPLQ